MKYPCTGCGLCCMVISKVVKLFGELANDPDSEFYFPYQWDENGVCENLDQDKNCKVYENRPTICSIEKMKKFYNISEKEYLHLNQKACTQIQNEFGITDEKYRVKLT